MRSSLKKSLYLGLAALSFASVAGAAFENTTTASAKKTTKKAKKTTKKATKKAYPKVTSLVNIASQDSQPVGYTISGGTLTNKPAGVKGAHDTATNVPSDTVFMRYQTATVSNGKTYYKVVSFDKKYRGFVSADQIQSTATYTNIDLGNNPAVYLKNPGNQALYTYPVKGTFKDQVAVEKSQTGKFASSQFGVNQKVTVKATGATYFHLVDLANTSVQGWVNASDVSTTPSRYFDQSADVKVNFVDSQTGNSVAQQIVNVTNNPNVKFTNLSSDRVLDPGFFSSIFNLSDNGTFTIADATNTDTMNSYLAGAGSGYAVTPADLAYSKQNFGTVKVGDTVNVKVTSTVDQSLATSPLKFKSISPVISGSTGNVTVQWNPADAKDINSSEVQFPTLTSTGQAAYYSDFQGNKNSFVGTKDGKGLNTVFTATDPLFGSNGFLSFFQGATNTSITSTSQYTNGYVSNSTSKANNNNDGQTTNAFNNQTSGMLAFTSDSAAQAAGAQTTDTKSLAEIVNTNKSNSNMTTLKIGQQFHFAYIIDRQATMQYNQWATLYGQPVTVVYDAVPVATPFSTSTSTTGFTGYIAK